MSESAWRGCRAEVPPERSGLTRRRALGALAAGGALLAVAAVGLRRVSPWARGPVVVLQLLLAALAYTTRSRPGSR